VIDQARRDVERAARDPEFAAQRAREAEAEREALRARRAAEIIAAAEAKLRSARRDALPAKVVRAFEAGLDETSAIQAARAHAQSDRVLLILGGAPGAGKTVAAATLMHRQRLAYVDEKTTCRVPYLAGRFVHSDDLAFADVYGREAREFWEDIDAAEILVIDDVGTRQPSEFYRANLVGLLTRRFDDCMETILTTNLDQAGFQRTFLEGDGGRLLDRLREGGTFFWTKGPSLRGRGGVK
jgi:DNA replication protein DnaC